MVDPVPTGPREGLRALPADDPVHFFQLLHQIHLVLQPPGGVAQQNIRPPGTGGLDAVVDYRRGVRPRLMADDIDAHPLSQISSCSIAPARKVSPAANTAFFPSSFNVGQLPDRRCLAHTVDADKKDDCQISACQLHAVIPVSSQEVPPRISDNSGFNSPGSFNFRSLTSVRSWSTSPRWCYADIGADQDLLQFLVKLLIDPAPAENRSIAPTREALVLLNPVFKCLCDRIGGAGNPFFNRLKKLMVFSSVYPWRSPPLPPPKSSK